LRNARRSKFMAQGRSVQAETRVVPFGIVAGHAAQG
jgi:hypothetical protein